MNQTSRPVRRLRATAVWAALLVCVAAGLAGCGVPAPPATWVRPVAVPAPTTAEPTDRETVPLPANLLAELPHFPPAPSPEPVSIPPGPVAGWFASIPTVAPVAFLTIDDGVVKVPQAEALLRAAHIPVTLFLDIDAIRDNPLYFARLQAVGATIEAHTITHQDLKGKSYAVQHNEICGSADQLTTLYGRRPVLFRPPYGDKDNTTLRVVRDCGMKAAFFWKETARGGAVQYQAGHQIAPGDIILMHFRSTFVADFIAALTAIHAAGLTPARLEDYIA